MKRIRKNYRLDPETTRQIATLAETWGTTESAAIVRCIERTWLDTRKDTKMEKRLWVVDWKPGNASVIPSPEFCPNLDEFEIIVADQFFTVVNADYNALDAAVQGHPYYRITGQPADGRWVGEGGDEVYIFNGRIVGERELWDGLGLKPGTFGGETWDDVDDDVVWDHVPQF